MKTPLILCVLTATVCLATVTVVDKEFAVIIGETAVIECKYESDSDNVPTFKWSTVSRSGETNDFYIFKKDDSDVTRRVGGVERTGLSVAEDGSLIIPSTELEDNVKLGRLRCEVDLGDAGKGEGDMKLIAALLPMTEAQMTLYPYSAGQEGFVMRDFPMSIGTCASSPSLPAAEIKFFKNGMSIETKGDADLDEILNAPVISQSEDGISSISSKDLIKVVDISDHQAEYICNVKTVYGEKQYEKNYTMPKFNVNHDTTMVKFVDQPMAILDETITLRCESDGFPQPAIKINEEVTAEKEITVTEEMNGDTYQCSAWNQPGQTPVVSEIYTINVVSISHPEIDGIEIIDDRAQVREGSLVSVTCSADGNPKPGVAWYKGDSMVSEDGSLTIESAKFGDSGDYTCKATNRYKQLEKMKMFSLDVRGLKRIGLEEVLVEGKMDDKVHLLECAVDSNPEPSSSWNVEESEPSLTKTGFTYTSQLEVGPFTPELSEKVYECTFTSDGISVSKTFKLPEIKKNVTSTEVIAAASGSTTVIIIVILLLILIVAIVLAVLYNKGIICKKQEKGDESAEGDMEVALNKEEADVEAGNGKAVAAPDDSDPPAVNADEERLMNGDSRDE